MTVRMIDEIAARAWPAPVVRRLDGWLLRAAGGVTRRANSALPVRRDVGTPLDATLRDAAEVYAAWGLPFRIQVTPGATDPPGLDAALAARGFTVEGTALLAAADLAEDDAPIGVRVDSTPDDAWMSAWWAFDRGAPGEPVPIPVGSILRARRPAVAHARVERNGEIVAVGRGVVEGGWLGIFAMATAPEHRGTGLARSVLTALRAWGHGRGARSAYLQVTPENAPARHLYATAGFAEIGSYHYRRAPETP